jgi:signal transduction histidine kinase
MSRKPLGWPKRPDPVVFVIVALLCAATLVIYLHHRALGAVNRQTTIILQKVAEQTAAAAALEMRKAFDGPVFDTLSSITHPTLVAGHLDVVAAKYRAGLATYPQLDRFFLWSRGTEERAPGEAVFYGPALDPTGAAAPGELGPFRRDPELGRQIVAAAERYAGARHIYAAVAANVDGVPYDVFIRIYYTGASRDRFLAVLGFVVNLDKVRTRLFPEVHRRYLANLLEPGDGTPAFEMRVLDSAGVQVYGPTTPEPRISARHAFGMQFYPADEIRTRMSTMLPERRWTLVVSPRGGDTPGLGATRMQGYWLSGLSVLLMFVALVVAINTSQRAAQLARMQAEFVAHVSHQLKTPVSLLSAVTETVTLDRVRSPEKLAHCMAIIRSQTSRLSALVEGILEFSRVSDRRGRYELEAVGLQTLVRETVDAFVAALEASGFRIEVANAPGTPIVAADPAALEQALINLLDNAIKYSGDSRLVTVRVGVAGSEAFVEVIDRGIGVPPDERERILERFYRGSGAAVHRNGFGLGLPIANEILLAHRGKLEVVETSGGGSTFRMRLPLLQDASRTPTRNPVWAWWRREAS